MGAYLTHALDEHNNLVYIDEVRKGNACNCRCPHCKEPLQARNGGNPDVRAHHFAHQSGHTCNHAYESQIHYIAKQVIEEEGGIMLPESEDTSKPSGFVHLHDVCVERYDSTYNFKPDVEGILDDGRRLIIECLVTHKVSEKKRHIILDNNLLCLEINVNWFEPDKKAIKQFITKQSDQRQWISEHKKSEHKENFSLSYSPISYIEASKFIVKLFEEKKLCICLNEPYWYYSEHEEKIYNLSDYGYDTYEIGVNFRGYKTDVLLFRSKKQDKGYISIKFRSRKRNSNARYPQNLRMIDVITSNNRNVKDKFHYGLLSPGMGVDFNGCWKY